MTENGAPPTAAATTTATKMVALEERLPVRRNKRGDLVRHSFLGNIEDLEKEHRRQSMDLSETAALAQPSTTAPQPPTQAAPPRVSRAGRFQRKATKPGKKRDEEFYASYLEERLKDRDARSLQHWNKTIATWERQERHISQNTGVTPEQLNMQSHELFQQKKQFRHAIEEAIPATEPGKGFRVGSEFWQPNPISKSSLHFTLTKTEKGERPPVEFTGRPRRVQTEMHVGPASYRSREHHKDHYMQERLQQLSPYLDDLARHTPDIDALEVVGRPLAVHDGMELLKGEENQGGDLAVAWRDEDKETEGRGQEEEEEDEEEGVGAWKEGEDEDAEARRGRKPPKVLFEIVDADASTPALDKPTALSSVKPLEPHEGCRVLFQTVPGQRSAQVLRITNAGSTAVYFRWQRVERDNSLGRREDEEQRFFLDIEPGAILPGAWHDMHLRFQSSSSGVFSEDWRLIVTPRVGEHTPVLSLCGVTESTDDFACDAQSFKHECELRQVKSMVQRLLHHIVTNIAPRPRPPTPDNQWRTDAERFIQQNPGLCTLETYREDVVQELAAFHARISVPAPASDDEPPSAKGAKKNRRKSEFVMPMVEAPTWSYCVADIHELCLSLPDEAQQEEALRELQSLCAQFVPRNHDLQMTIDCDRVDVGKLVLRRLAGDIVGHSQKTLQDLGVRTAEIEASDSGDLAVKRKSDLRSAKSRGTKSRTESARTNPGTSGAGTPAPEPMDPVKRAIYQQRLFEEVRRCLVRRVDEMVDNIVDLPPAAPLADDADDQ